MSAQNAGVDLKRQRAVQKKKRDPLHTEKCTHFKQAIKGRQKQVRSFQKMDLKGIHDLEKRQSFISLLAF